MYGLARQVPLIPKLVEADCSLTEPDTSTKAKGVAVERRGA